MEEIHQRLASLGLAVPEILLPVPSIDLSKWAVIACDQFTWDRSYWEAAKNTVGTSPSTLNIILPEVYLNKPDRQERVRRIHRTMADYLGNPRAETGVFSPPQKAFVYIERSSPFHRIRRGFLAALDLEQYDWRPEARPLIRSTEGTVSERLPPRMDVRRGAPLETPHIIVLIDDEAGALLPGIAERAKKDKPAYSASLMQDAGAVSGWFLKEDAAQPFLAESLTALAERAVRLSGASDPAPFLYAVGDGNHSLAAAKAVWDEFKTAHPGVKDHPCRWALVEIENIYDEGINFEPIHRLILGAEEDELLSLLSALPGSSSRPVSGRAELSALVRDEDAPGNRLGLIAGARCTLIETRADGIITDSLQPLLDEWLTSDGLHFQALPAADQSPAAGMVNAPRAIDYIHGEEELFHLAGTQGRPSVGILLPPIKKSGLFQTVAQRGPLPRKSFSMGEAVEKRFYLECRRLF
ncbi:MAG: DUF1015 domain-containing protein [Treponema sp.]|jgi:hypothetical protein|nr:DUF1015 domain-containing protein [Treponema sp.]